MLQQRDFTKLGLKFIPTKDVLLLLKNNLNI